MPHSIECQRRRYWNPNRLCDCNTDEWPIEPLPVDSETLEKFIEKFINQTDKLPNIKLTHNHDT